MWKQVERGEWPFWALDVTSLWQHKTGHWLANKENERSSLWELRSPDGLVLTNQLDLPFSEGLAGAPITWANRELADRKDRSRVQP
jgi:hypothetical protein